ncbi:Phospholipase A2 [Nesidiocoris tenuis]|uniref:phospholipase A2 n=1 Tax=Nesidiocoris tenuis TaxID=355587 RepID=A0ABN7ABF1_9HEMI|nr:Phospholipase A2 [Nesidiocoris tenuis]
MAWLSNILKKTFSSQIQPNEVVEVETKKYDNRMILHREENIFLYAGNGEDLKYEIVMHKPCTESFIKGFSLFRSQERFEAEERFIILKDKLPILANVSNCMQNQATIQKCCNVFEQHPSWNVCHLAVFFNLVDAISLPEIISLINTPCVLTGLSPLQLAVQSANLPMLQKLLSAEVDLAHLDHDANSVYHYAAATSKEVISVLTAKDSDLKGLNHKNVAGHTPLHMACIADKPECVIALITAGSDVNLAAGSPSKSSRPTTSPFLSDFMSNAKKQLVYEEMKYGGNPLHWASSREVIEALVDRQCDINALNFASRTALQVMVMRNKVECVVTLLSREADVDIADLDGNTALHLAVIEMNIPIIQALIVFGSKLDHMNNAGETPRHLAAKSESPSAPKVLYVLHAVGAPRCKALIETCTPGCAPDGTDNGTPLPPASAGPPSPVQTVFEKEALEMEVKGSTRGGRVLSLDGGGIRGLVLIMNLLHLEEALGRPLIHCFDWIAATSTGGMLGLAIASGKTLKECLCIYFRMKEQFFVGYRPYNSKPLETMLQEVLGEDTVMGDIAHPKVMITAVLADRKPVDLHLFRNYESPNEMLSSVVRVPPGTGPQFEGFVSYREQKIWEAARATGAAPSYFRAYKRFVDGGLISNNPTFDAITEIHEYNTALKLTGREDEIIPPKVIVSIGTGSIPLTEMGCMDIFWPSGVWDAAKAYTGVMSMQAVLVDQATLADGRLIDRTRAVCSMLGIPYFRFSPTMTEEIQMDEKSDVKLCHLLWETKAAIFAQSAYVNKVAMLLNA